MIELARRRMMMGGNPLPYDAEVEWIGGTAFSLVITDTPVVGFVNHEAKLVNINVSPTVEFLRIGNSSKEYLNYRLGNRLNLYENNANNRSLQFDVCGNVYTRYMQPFDNSAGSHKNFSLRGNASDYVYSYFIQIFDSQRNLVLDLIPVRVGQTGCLFDKVNNKLYYATTGTPDFGPDKIA